jgi:hypothetical protein
VSLFWGVLFPFLLSAMAGAVYWALRLQFFSNKEREIVELLYEVEELDVENFQRLLSGPADEYLASRYGGLNFRQRQEVAHKRFSVVRRGLQAIISNAVLCEQAGRFHIRKIHENDIDPKLFTEENELAFKTFDRATVCHVLAALAYAKLQVLELCHIAWPWYVPALRGLCGTGSHSLYASYKDLVSAILELARQDRREWVYDNLLFALTGLIECSDDALSED